VWREYLAAGVDDKELKPATIWYRIGTLCQKADAHEEALEAFYRSESLGGAEELASETGRKVQESLEALGKFAALRHELSERVGLEADAGAASGEVVAEIGAQKITRAELDRQIESGIENQLAMFAGQLPDEQRKQQKEAMLKQFGSDQQRLQFLHGYIVQEILYRKARESGVMDDPEVRAQLRDAERSLLARRLMESELRGKTFVSEADVAIYYEARKGEFLEPASAALSHLVLADEEAAKGAIERILAGEEFTALAKELSTDAATKDRGGALETPAVKGQGIRGMSLPPGALDPLFEAKAGDILDEPVKSEAGYHVFQVRELTPERQKPLEEVSSQIYGELYRQKEQELQAKLLEDLRDEYDVVIHQEAFKGATEGSE
jgi:parvulin-like peptidyl-prolyl isomerase